MLKNRKPLITALAGVTVLAATFVGGALPAAASAKKCGTYTLGLLTDLTGPAASGNKTSPTGIKAGEYLANKAGCKITYFVGDTATSATGALSSAQKLVEQDHVNAVVAVSALALTVSNWLTQHGVPVIGVAEDGSEWVTAKNMFSVFGPLNATQVTTTFGKFFKMQGAKNLASLGYSVSPISSEETQGVADSAKKAGLKVGYENAAFPFGSTNVAPVALAMKNASVDSFTAETDPNTAFALLTALKQEGAHIKVALQATGYGGDLQQAGPGALTAAQGVYFLSPFEPLEMHNAATTEFKKALASAGVTGDPTYGEYAGYTSVALFLAALKNAPANPTSAQLITALGKVKHFTAAGLLGPNGFNLSQRSGFVTGPHNCFFVTHYSSGKFLLVPGADPICGTIINGETVAPASS
jgi:ABC-type branched-subunit amino acid transport system substrate-binding protein